MAFELSYAENGSSEQTLSLYLAADTGVPLLVFVHGGAWISGEKGEHAEMAKRFAEDGISVALVNYRLSTDPTVRSPSHAQDVAAAYAWLVENAGVYGCQPSKIFVMGHSAGAHNAGIIATSDELVRAGVPPQAFPRGFIGLEGIYDIPTLIKVWPGYRDWFIERAFGVEEAWSIGSPTRRDVLIKSPWLVIHSAEDELVDLEQSRDFAKHLANQGVNVRLNDGVPGKHDEVILTLGQTANPVAAEIQNFIHELS